VPVPRVLVADDSPLVLRIIEKMLAGAGYAVLTARDGIEAIEKAVAEGVDLVILDVMMPRMNGYQACRILKTEPTTRSVPVVILTSKDQAGDRFWGLETGADYYVTKDSEPLRILELVKNILASDPGPPRRADTDARTSGVDILSRVNDLLDRKLYEATILSEIGRVARGLVQFDQTLNSVMALVARVVDFSVGGMAFVERDEVDLELLVNRRTPEAVVDEARARLLEALVAARGGAALDAVRTRVLADATNAPAAEDTLLGGFASFPVETNNRLAGMLMVTGRAVERMTPETRAFLAQVANQAHIVIENSRLFERVRNLAIRDSLTDLFNHRHIMDLVQHEFERVGRYQSALSVLMIDVDHFKRINDEHGHPAGDAVLREMAQLLRQTLRTTDALGRTGGEEFVAVLPHTGPEEARQTAERIRYRVQQRRFRAGEAEVSISVSLGMASCPSSAIDSADALLREADKALYRAKESGRNRVAS
jgi:two-component system cell cycle response regulator